MEVTLKGNGQATPTHRKSSQMAAPASELTVCDITGDWGAYQWSICLFATLYSALASQMVISGPLLTPDMAHTCAPPFANQTAQVTQDFTKQPHECFKIIQTNDQAAPPIQVECVTFLYDDQQAGAMLTNSFDLVCDREWLRSFVSSAALTGMLISSVTLGLFSDKFGRLRCIQIGFIISCSANALAILTQNYYIFCACVLAMSYAQVGAANALCTLLMEATSPRFRFIPVFEYGIGWGLGVMLVPLINLFTRDYRLFMGVVLVWQLAMAPWLHWGIFESIRWLLSEGHFNRAQIELRRACRMNQVKTAGAQLMQDIARIQTQQVRKASRIIETNMAPVHLARALGARVDETARELDMLNDAIKLRVFSSCGGGGGNDNEPEVAPNESHLSLTPRPSLTTCSTTSLCTAAAAALSPTLSRMSFCVTATSGQPQPTPAVVCPHQSEPLQHIRNKQLEAIIGGGENGERRPSFTTQGLIQLALKYSKTVARHDEGQFFLVQMFHRKLWRNTTILLLISIMYETSYYGLMQASKFVGKSVELNFVLGGLSEWAAALLSMAMLAYTSRKCSLIATTLLGALICFSMAASYQLVPDLPNSTLELPLPVLVQNKTLTLPLTTIAPPPEVDSLIDNEANLEPLSSAKLLEELQKGLGERKNSNNNNNSEQEERLIDLRHQVNMYLMHAGKLIICVGIQVAATISMEVYPNNLRQTGSGAIVFVGRIGSILAPFLFNDPTPGKNLFKATLVAMALIGLIVCLFIPFTITDNKGKELCDQMDEIGADADDDDDDAMKERI